MGAVRQAMIFAAALAGGIGLSQAPEFAQQYRQRIGGAIEELQHVVAEFDSDATKNGLTRTQALAEHATAVAPLFRDRGRSMQVTIDRLDRLSRQNQEFANAAPFAQPLMLLDADETLLAGVWRDYEPAVPVTPAGLGWGAAGFFFLAAIAWTLFRILRSGARWALSARPAPARRAVRGSG